MDAKVLIENVKRAYLIVYADNQIDAEIEATKYLTEQGNGYEALNAYIIDDSIAEKPLFVSDPLHVYRVRYH